MNNMKIATTSDIHSDITPQNLKLIPFLAAQVERLAPDVFVLAGDIANTVRGWAGLGRTLASPCASAQ
jgi:3',5'-cyclic AMP phosphodiesterase CpdA